MVKDVFNKRPTKFKEAELNKSAGILDDFAVRKDIATREGTIEHVPTNNNHIVNKKYVDDEISGVDESKWTRTGTLLTTKTANDDVRVDGSIGIGTAPNSIHNIVTNKILGAGGSMFYGSSSTTAGENGSGISGFVVPSTGTYTGKSFAGLDFGVFGFLTTVSGAPNSTGLSVFGYGNFEGTHTLGTIKGIAIEGIRRVGGTLNATNYYGLDIPDIQAFTSLTNQYQLNIGKPTRGTNNYQVVLLGNGAGSGIWFDGTSGERLYSDGTDLISTKVFKANGYKSSDGSAGITATITTAALTPGGSTGSMTFKNGLLTAQTAAT